MNWKSILAIIAAVGLSLVIGLWWGSRQGTQEVARRDAVKAAKHAEAIQRADVRAEEAELQALEGKQWRKAYEAALKDKKSLKGRLSKARAALRNRPATTSDNCADQLGKCDTLVKELDATQAATDNALFNCDGALGSCRAETASLRFEIEDVREADKIQTGRVKTWQQQTRKGRVKTAFYGIGMAAGGGAIGYLGGRYSQ